MTSRTTRSPALRSGPGIEAGLLRRKHSMNSTSSDQGKLIRKPRNHQEHNSIGDIARQWLALGASPIPVNADGSKSPAVPWKGFQEEAATSDQIDNWFKFYRGLGIVTGFGGLELLEFENEATWTRWCRDMVHAGLTEDLRALCDGYLARSGGGGYHLIYRTSCAEANAKLARLPRGETIPRYVEHDGSLKTSDVLIETRGIGGYVVVAGGDPAVHPTGRPYRRVRLAEHYVREQMANWSFDCERGVVLQNHSRRKGSKSPLSPVPDHLHEISVELREQMFTLARLQDRREPSRQKGEHHSDLTPTSSQGVAGARPGDAWAAVTTWDEILCPHGWRRDHSTDQSDRWTRPGKASGVSATTDYAGSGLLYVFSSSTEFETGDDETYTKFGAYATLNHGGDLHAAALDLVERGFADPLRADADTREQRVVQMAVQAEMRLDAEELARRNRASRDMRVPPTRTMVDALLRPLPEPVQLVDGLVIGEGVTLLSAQNKTGKSTVGLNLIRSLLYDEPLFERFATHLPQDAGIGVWNAEVSASTYERWAIEHGIDDEHAKRLAFFHMSGYAVDLLLPTWREQTVQWLCEHNVKLWLLDPFSKIFRGDENSASEVNAWWMTLREIMSEADCPAAFVIHHAGHTDDDKRARARGSSAIEGDPEVVLSYRHGGKPGNFPPNDKRYLSGVGRIDNIPSVTLDYSADTRSLFVDENSQGMDTDRQVQEDEAVGNAAWALLDGDTARRDEVGAWVSKQQIKDADTGLGDKKTLTAIDRCVARGYLVVEITPNGKPDKVRHGKRRPR